MTNEKFTWETTFETAKDLMIHTMTDRVCVVSNIKAGVVKVLRDGTIIDYVENPLVCEYEKFLLGVAKCVQNLDKLIPKES